MRRRFGADGATGSGLALVSASLIVAASNLGRDGSADCASAPVTTPSMSESNAPVLSIDPSSTYEAIEPGLKRFGPRLEARFVYSRIRRNICHQPHLVVVGTV